MVEEVHIQRTIQNGMRTIEILKYVPGHYLEVYRNTATLWSPHSTSQYSSFQSGVVGLLMLHRNMLQTTGHKNWKIYAQ